MTTVTKSTGSEACTHGVRVAVRPVYLPQQSKPDAGQYVWAYRIRITNESDQTVQLRTRHWIIVDADGQRRDVEGDGVVGQQPVLAPGETFEYTSVCPLETDWGTMEGSFRFEAVGNADVPEFDAMVARCYLVP